MLNVNKGNYKSREVDKGTTSTTIKLLVTTELASASNTVFVAVADLFHTYIHNTIHPQPMGIP